MLRLRYLLLGALLCAGVLGVRPGCAVAADADPFEHIIPSIKSLAEVRALVVDGYGVPPPDIVGFEGTITDSAGSRIDYREALLGDDFAIYQNAADVHRAFGSYRGQYWRQNENGITRILTEPADVSLLDPRQLWKVVISGSAGLVLDGELHAPIAAYVLEESIQADRAWFYFDMHTGLLDHARLVFPGGQRVYTFQRYQQQAGVATPMVVVASDEENTYTSVDTITHFASTGSQSATTLAIPSSQPLVSFPKATDSLRLPSRFNGKDIVVRVNIGGRGLDFLLDSGTAGIVIDRDVADQLGFARSPAVNFLQTPNAGQSYVRIPSLSIGDMQMRNVNAFALPFAVQADPQTKYVGLLGYDFFCGAALKIDYEHQRVDATRPERFQASGAISPIGLTLDEGVPIARAQAGDDWARVMIDTGSGETLFFSKYLAAHNVPAPSFKTASTHALYYPLEHGTLNGMVPTVSFTFGYLRLQDYYFADSPVRISVAVPKFEDPECDGLIGASILSYFNVYFDYAHARMYLEPNATFKAMQSRQGARR